MRLCYAYKLTCHIFIEDSRAKFSDLFGDASDEALSLAQCGSKDIILSGWSAISVAIIVPELATRTNSCVSCFGKETNTAKRILDFLLSQ